MEKNNTFLNKLKSITKKKWFLPGVYLFIVAILLVSAVWYQLDANNSSKNNNKDGSLAKSKKPEAVEVAKPVENFILPLNDSDDVVVVGQFYDAKADKKTQEMALIKFENTYQPNTGIDYALKSDQRFDVLASMSGKVINVQTDSLLGNIVEIEHSSGIVTQYSSIDDIVVQQDDQVMQGTAIAKSSTSAINEAAKTHVHFEIRKDGVAINPALFFKKPLSALEGNAENAQSETDNKVEEEKTNATKNESQESNEEK